MQDAMLFLSVFGSGCLLDCSFAKTPGAQIGVRGCFGAPGAAEFWYTWNGDLAL